MINHPLSAVSNITATEYQPEGGTALWDVIGNMIEIAGQRFDNAANPPRVLIVIITDGEETSSTRYSLPHVREMITRRQRACGWSFIIIAPNAASLAFKLGIPVTHARNWKSDPDAITGLLERVGKTISAYKLGDKKAMLRLSE